MSLIQEFKKFALRGNVVDLAVGVIIGAAFGKIVSSLVDDIIMPPIGRVLGGVDFRDLFYTLNGQAYQSLDAAKKAGAPVIAYGQFFNHLLNFLIVAFCVFMLVKGMNKLVKKEEQKPAPPPPPSAQEKLLAEIRDLLKEAK
ncbi:MAG: large conductance mechanosensitive channel protein MscL [Verrucomicrobiota bacterium]|nr:large conductance mechanosensitive channel protein MscL [Verrucomicrobiota bacterium]